MARFDAAITAFKNPATVKEIFKTALDAAVIENKKNMSSGGGFDTFRSKDAIAATQARRQKIQNTLEAIQTALTTRVVPASAASAAANVATAAAASADTTDSKSAPAARKGSVVIPKTAVSEVDPLHDLLNIIEAAIAPVIAPVAEGGVAEGDRGGIFKDIFAFREKLVAAVRERANAPWAVLNTLLDSKGEIEFNRLKVAVNAAYKASFEYENGKKEGKRGTVLSSGAADQLALARRRVTKERLVAIIDKTDPSSEIGVVSSKEALAVALMYNVHVISQALPGSISVNPDTFEAKETGDLGTTLKQVVALHNKYLAVVKATRELFNTAKRGPISLQQLVEQLDATRLLIAKDKRAEATDQEQLFIYREEGIGFTEDFRLSKAQVPVKKYDADGNASDTEHLTHNQMVIELLGSDKTKKWWPTPAAAKPIVAANESAAAAPQPQQVAVVVDLSVPAAPAAPTAPTAAPLAATKEQAQKKGNTGDVKAADNSKRGSVVGGGDAQAIAALAAKMAATRRASIGAAAAAAADGSAAASSGPRGTATHNAPTPTFVMPSAAGHKLKPTNAPAAVAPVPAPTDGAAQHAAQPGK
jgi:hypothetical protein